MNRRIVVNLAAFGLLFAVLAVWAVRNVLHLQIVEKPYTVTAEFERSPGLRPDVEVAYLGTRIGTIGSVSLEPGHVEVSLRIDQGVELPADVTAAVRRKSAVGEPYVDLAPGPGTDEELAAGDRIPLDRTSTPLDYAELFAALADLVHAVPPEDVETMIHEMAVGLDGRAASINTMVTGLAELTRTFAARDDTLDELATDLTRLTNVFAEHRQAMASGTDDLALLAGTLAESRADIEALLTRPSFLARFATLLETSGDELGCLVDSLGMVGAELTTPAQLVNLSDLLGLGPEMLHVFQNVHDEEADGPYIRTVNPVNLGLGGPPTPQYDTPPPHPAVPPLQSCPAADDGSPAVVPASGNAGAGDGEAAAGAPAEPRGGMTPVPVAPQPTAVVGPPPDDGGLGPWPLVLAVTMGVPFVLAGVAARRDRKR